MPKTPTTTLDQTASEAEIPAPAKKPARAKKQAKVRQPYTATLSRDPNLAGFEPDYGNFANVGSPEFRSHITAVLTSVEAVNRIIGSVSAAPSRPPVAAIEQLLVDHGGETAFDKEPKKMIGRLIRQIIEHLGGSFVRRGVPLNVASRFKKGSIYTF
jgi:hypothetical protein